MVRAKNYGTMSIVKVMQKKLWPLFVRTRCMTSYLSYLGPFLRYGDLLAENCIFFLPLSYLASPLPMFPLEFRDEINHAETSHGATLWWKLHDPNFNRF